MLNYAICEISGKQYKIIPNKPIEVDLLEGDKNIEAQVLLLSEDGKLKIGTPFLKEKLALQFVDNIKKDKIRVAKFHAKANFRKVTGQRPKKTRLIFTVKKEKS